MTIYRKTWTGQMPNVSEPIFIISFVWLKPAVLLIKIQSSYVLKLCICQFFSIILCVKWALVGFNQMHAQVKLTEMWKAVHYTNFPLNIEQLQPAVNGRTTRGVSDGKLLEPSSLNTFIGNATRLWNKAPIVIKNSKSISVAKKEIKQYCKSLPI